MYTITRIRELQFPKFDSQLSSEKAQKTGAKANYANSAQFTLLFNTLLAQGKAGKWWKLCRIHVVILDPKMNSAKLV